MVLTTYVSEQQFLWHSEQVIWMIFLAFYNMVPS